MEQHFQDVAQKFINDNNSYSFAAHFAKYFTQKASPQQCKSLSSVIPDQQRIPQKNKRKKTSDTLITGKESIQD